nr:MAG TPA: hypothetical protein [Caudoviricetes sp.]
MYIFFTPSYLSWNQGTLCFSFVCDTHIYFWSLTLVVY